MGTTYLKRQKEMKRLEKQRQKAERRAQKKLADRAQGGIPADPTSPTGDETTITSSEQLDTPEATSGVPAKSSFS